jgi:hypothetical protein
VLPDEIFCFFPPDEARCQMRNSVIVHKLHSLSAKPVQKLGPDAFIFSFIEAH